MKLSLKSLFSEHSDEANIIDTLDIHSIEFGKESAICKDGISFKAHFKKIDIDSILLTGNYECNLEVNCSRCNELTTYYMAGKFNKDLKLNHENNDAEEDYITGYNFDISAFILNEIFIEYPMKVLCDESCKGICKKCGINLNNKSCNCDNDNVDPRLLGLKAIFDENFKEV